MGSAPPRPRPARKRRAPKAKGDGANAHARVSSENVATAPMSALRRPKMSVIAPMVTAPIVMPTSPITEITDAEPGFSPHARYSSSEGSTAPSTTRSKPSRRIPVQHSGRTHRACAAESMAGP